MHGANKGKDTKIRKEIAIATKCGMRHQWLPRQPRLVHGAAVYREINAHIRNAYGIALTSW
ncbi:MAG: hypothetical protein ACLUJ0_14600 [Ruthenibacterium lactatiformans]